MEKELIELFDASKAKNNFSNEENFNYIMSGFLEHIKNQSKK